MKIIFKKIYSRELSRFYSQPPRESEEEEGGKSWKSFVEEVVFGLGRKGLFPPRAMAKDMTFTRVASLPELYKVFERC